MKREMNFELRYVSEMDPHLIYNLCGLLSSGPVGWLELIIKNREAATRGYITTMNKKQEFYKKLEASVLKIGFRNPILIRCGWCTKSVMYRIPLEMQNNPNNILVCDSHGGSRLWVAQKNNIKIPCLIQDYNGRFSDEELIPLRKEDILKYYTDTPKNIKINARGISVAGLPQIHLENN